MSGDSFFEEMYQGAGDDFDSLPWARLEPLPAFVEWLDRQEPGDGRAALVVGSGLGDDAEELASRGWRVSAFDLSPTAIEMTRRRFPESTVDYRAADLLELPAEWNGRFDLVVEIRTLQSMPIEVRGGAPAAVAVTIGPGGRLWVHILGRDEHEPDGRRPYPLTPDELAGFERAGLAWESRRDVPLADGEYPTASSVYEVIGELRRPA